MRTAIALALLALLLAGCGSGGGKAGDDYALAVNGVQAAFSKDLLTASTRLSRSTKTEDDARALRTAAAAVSKAADSLESLPAVPDKVKGENRRLVTVLRTYATSVRNVAALVSTGAPSKFAKAGDDLKAASDKVRAQFSATVTKINDALD